MIFAIQMILTILAIPVIFAAPAIFKTLVIPVIRSFECHFLNGKKIHADRRQADRPEDFRKGLESRTQRVLPQFGGALRR